MLDGKLQIGILLKPDYFLLVLRVFVLYVRPLLLQNAFNILAVPFDLTTGIRFMFSFSA
jgi:hypothetical protein